LSRFESEPCDLANDEDFQLFSGHFAPLVNNDERAKPAGSASKTTTALSQGATRDISNPKRDGGNQRKYHVPDDASSKRAFISAVCTSAQRHKRTLG
jgi:hypothetical protein